MNSILIFLISLILSANGLALNKTADPKSLGTNCLPVYSESHGGNGGSDFSDADFLFSLSSHCDMRVEEVQLRSGSRIDQIRLKIGNGKISRWTSTRGGNGGAGPFSFIVPQGENIVTVVMRTGSRVDSLQFITDKGTTSPQFGGNGGTLRVFHLDGKLIGLYGRSGREVDKLGFISLKDGPAVGY